MDTIRERIFNCGIIPVAVIEDAKDAVPTAMALKSGGIDVIEITMRTNAGLQAVENISKACPDMLVIAGTVLTLENCIQCIAAGAKGIVSPGFDKDIVQYCLDNQILVIPGTVTPTEIQNAMTYGLDILKFFPANVYGGSKALKSLAGPFTTVSFIPTGGVDEQNVGEYTALSNVFAVGGSWVCAKQDISNQSFGKITELTQKALQAVLGFEFVHPGINTDSEEESLKIANAINERFGFPIKLGNSSNFAGEGFEITRKHCLDRYSHIAGIRTNNVKRAVHYLTKKGFEIDPETARYKNGKLEALFLRDEVGGFAIHLLQK